MIYVPNTKKIYSAPAILAWSEFFSTSNYRDWERYLVEPEILKKGRENYRKIPHPYSICVERECATVVLRLEEFGDLKLILSLTPRERKLQWQCVNELDPQMRAAFAVAAIYFVEEFIADEAQKVSLSATENFENEAQKSVPAGIRGEVGNFASLKKSVPVAQMSLRLQFSLSSTKLFLRAEFVDEKERSREPINALAKVAGTEQILSPRERELRTKLYMYAHRAGFFIDADQKNYSLAGIGEIEQFVKQFLPIWRKAFPRIEGADFLAKIFAREPLEVVAGAQLTSARGNTFSLDWFFTIGGRKLSPSESRILLENRRESVFLPGRGIAKIYARSNELIDDWQNVHGEKLPLYSLLSLFKNEQANRLILTDEKLTAWKKKFFKPARVLAGTPAFLRPYQQRGVAWLRKMLDCGLHPLIADEMGLGKTLQILAAISLDSRKNCSILVLCPASVVPVWENEIRKFFPQFSVKICHSWHKSVPANRNGITLSSYGFFRNNQRQFCRKKFTYAVLDEAQFIKNPSTKIARACFEIQARHRIALTGTPIENRHLDLWTIFRFLMPGLLGKHAALEAELENADELARERFLQKLRTQIAPFILRRTKEEVARDLPEKVLTTLVCPMTEKQREIYEAIARAGVDEYKNADVGEIFRKKSLNFLTLLLRLRQAACDPSLLHGNATANDSGKLVALGERIEEIVDNNGKIVIFSQFVQFLNRAENYLRERFPNVPFFALTGSTIDRAKPVRDFQNASGPAIFLISLRAGGTGLTLTSAEYVFLLDPWWNPAVEEQAIDRVHRIGQTKRVFVYRMISENTIEDRIERLKQNKRELFASVLGNAVDISNWSQFYPTLESLFALKD